MTPKEYTFRYRVRNWPDYNRALIARGRLTFWFDEEAVVAWRNTDPATLLDALATRCQNTCRVGGEGRAATFEQRTAPTPLQKRAFELLGL